MADQGIGHQVITFPGALGPDVLPAAEAVPLVRDVNDELAAVCAAHPARFIALAGLPLADIDASVAELERACGSLGLRGAIIPSKLFPKFDGVGAAAPRCWRPPTRWVRTSWCIPGSAMTRISRPGATTTWRYTARPRWICTTASATPWSH